MKKDTHPRVRAGFCWMREGRRISCWPAARPDWVVREFHHMVRPTAPVSVWSETLFLRYHTYALYRICVKSRVGNEQRWLGLLWPLRMCMCVNHTQGLASDDEGRMV